ASVPVYSDGDGVVATFFLIRYQSVLASRREMIFACQFFRISFFIIRALQQNFADSFPERFRGEITLDSAAMTNRNSAGLFRDHDGNGIGFLGQPQTGAMPQTETAIERFALADRENARCRCNPAIPDNYTTVVQSSLRMKNGE